MSKNWVLGKLDQVELLSHMSNPIAKAGHKTGNASGVHGKFGKAHRRSERSRNHFEEQMVRRGEYDE